MALVLTTDSVAPRQREAFWQEMVCQSFVKARCSSRVDDAFCGKIATENFGEVEISTIDARRNRVERRRSDIAQCNRPRYYLCYQAVGRAKYVERGIESLLDTGEMIILNNCEPYAVEYDDHVMSIVMQVPQSVLSDRFQSPDRYTGRKLSQQRGITKITGEFLASCAAHANDLTSEQRALTARMSLDLLTDLLMGELGHDGRYSGQQAILISRIKRFLLSKVADPALDLTTVASAVGLSTRYVTKLFTVDGEPLGRFLLRARIDHSKRELESSALDNLSIGAIGIRAGFNNMSHFSRVFRESTGRTPSEYRAESRQTLARAVRDS